jgi:hypothetical protein
MSDGPRSCCARPQQGTAMSGEEKCKCATNWSPHEHVLGAAWAYGTYCMMNGCACPTDATASPSVPSSEGEQE